MKDEMFAELVASVKEGGSFPGKAPATGAFVNGDTDTGLPTAYALAKQIQVMPLNQK